MLPSAGIAPAPGRQIYVERPAVPALAELVSAVWIQQVAPGAEPYTHRSVPNGGVELLCRIGALPRVVGPLTTASVETLEAGTTVIGMRFRPGAASAVLGLPASELVDLVVGADELWGAAGMSLAEDIAAAASPQQALAGLQRHVIGWLADAPACDPLVSEAVRLLMPWRSDDVSSLTSSLFVSERQLRRRCKEAVGLAPKVLHRTLRFQGFLALTQHALAHGRAPSDDGMALLAAEAGYADQPHLNRECLRLTGVSPREFLGEAEHQCGSGHDHAVSYLPLLSPRMAAPAR